MSARWIGHAYQGTDAVAVQLSASYADYGVDLLYIRKLFKNLAIRQLMRSLDCNHGERVDW